ncbi:MAG: hypothetical protein ACLUFD_00110 [Faecalibacterium sp.]
MKKKILALLWTSMLCFLFSISCFAASKPAIELTRTELDKNSVGGASPTVYYCNNSSKTIKYITWYMTPYNAVGDAVRCSIRGYSQARGLTTGPIEPYHLDIPSSPNLFNDKSVDQDGPFSYIDDLTFYYINNGVVKSIDNLCDIYIDKYNQPFVRNYNSGTSNYATYLTEDEIKNAAYKFELSYFDCLWYNSTIRDFRVNKAVVEFMDGTKQTVSSGQLYGERYHHILQNKPFVDIVNQYSSVYNYKDYMKYNPDLAAVFNDNQKALFEHFINSGMKEGRQGSSEFNLTVYKANNPDLVALFGDDNVKYYEHYIAGGKAEGRVASSDTSSTSGTVISTLSDEEYSQLLEKYAPVYNAKEYIRFNLDVASLGGNQKALLEHFITVGMKEGRQGSSQFNLAAYKANNPDLVALFGDDNVKYYEHYMAGGKAEGRVAV